MPNPFPGVDPYIEWCDLWPDFHQRFLTYWGDALLERLPDQYDVRLDERVALIERDVSEVEIRSRRPDLGIVQREPYGPAPAPGPAVTLAPVTLPLVRVTEEVRDVWLEIRHRPEDVLVTVIELLSPTNKGGIGHAEYLEKRQGFLRQRVHLVELDLLLGGERLYAASLPRGDYYAFVTRRDRRPHVDIYGWSIRQALPVIPIPLKAPDPDVTTDLAAVFQTAYERGRYARALSYAKAVPSGLSTQDVTWARELASRT